MNQPKHLEDAFSEVCKEMEAVFVKKHNDYGKGNILDTQELGIAFRVSDKLNRIKHLLANQKDPEFESIEETWIDIGVYAVIAVMLKRSWFKKLELKEKDK